MLVDSFKVAHWMNVRKLTAEEVAARARIDGGALRALLEHGQTPLPDGVGTRLSEVLKIDPTQIAPSATSELAAITLQPEELRATRRPIQRDGIHFYNYYSMAGPPGRVAPVILDILCPADRLPALNNGHLEPAITINIGPGDIYGRWGNELTSSTWQALGANHDRVDAWITGDSYVEPSYCPHSYSLASDKSARIISYTSASNLAPLFDEVNDWTEHAFDSMLADLRDGCPGDLLRCALARRGFEAASAAAAIAMDPTPIERFLDGDVAALSLDELRMLGDTLGFDYRSLLTPPRRHDEVGKTCCSIEDSRATVRRFRSYTVASMASAPHLPDLVGSYMRIDKPAEPSAELDLCESGESHYMVVQGDLTLIWRDTDGTLAQVTLTADGTAWTAPYVAHAWRGCGALIRMGSGRHLSYLDQLELSNTFDAASTLRRGRRDALGWGYDSHNGG